MERIIHEQEMQLAAHEANAKMRLQQIEELDKKIAIERNRQLHLEQTMAQVDRNNGILNERILKIHEHSNVGPFETSDMAKTVQSIAAERVKRADFITNVIQVQKQMIQLNDETVDEDIKLYQSELLIVASETKTIDEKIANAEKAYDELQASSESERETFNIVLEGMRNDVKDQTELLSTLETDMRAAKQRDDAVDSELSREQQKIETLEKSIKLLVESIARVSRENYSFL